MSRTACAIDKDVVPASFKGVQFYCTEATVEGGRRGAEGEFPFGEETAYADLGRKIRNYNLTAVFRDDDHVLDSGALFAVCESPGPGILVHPTRGTVMVACKSIKVRDPLEEEAGQTHAEMEFVEANPIGTGLGGLLFGLLTTGLNLASQASFLSEYHPTTVAQPWSGDIIDHAQALVASNYEHASLALKRDAALQAQRDLLQMIEVAQDDGLASIATEVDSAMVIGFQTISTNITDPATTFKVMKKLVNIATHIPVELPAGDAVISDEALLSRHRILAAMGMSQAAMSRKYRYVDQALSAMDDVLIVLEDEAKAAYDACNNILFLELRKYATDFAKMMNDLAYRLPTMIAVNFMGGVHPLVASYAIYRDAKRHRDLEQGNRIDANGKFGPVVIGVAPA